MCAGGVSGVSFAWANNETGALQDAAVLCSSAGKHGVPVHLDIVQCAGKFPWICMEWKWIMLPYPHTNSMAPKGLDVCTGERGLLFPFAVRGGQEYGLRSGTENVPGIIGFGAAARAALRHLEEDAGRLSRMRDSFESLLRAQVGGVTVHSGGTERIPNTSNLAFDGCTAEALMLLLEPAGLLCSAGSACHTLQPMPSHVLTAMGLSDEAVRSSLRFSLSFMTTQEEVEQAAALVGSAVRKVRGVQSSRTGPVLVYRPEWKG